MMLNSYISISKNKLFVLSSTLVLLFLMVLHILYFETFSRHVLKNDFSAKQFHLIEKNGSKIEVAAIGTSHTDNGLRDSFGNFFNYGRMSTYFPQVAYAKVSHLLKFAPELKVLLLEVDHLDVLVYSHTTHTSMPDNHLYLLKYVNESLYGEKRAKMNNRKMPFLLSLQADVAPVIHRKYFQSYLVGRGKKKEISSWATLTSKEKVKSAKKRLRASNLNRPLKIDKAVRDYYTKVINKAEKQGIKVYLIFYPQTKEYLAEINEKNNKKVDDFVLELSKEKGVKVLDFRQHFELQEEFFENQDHLNKKGSEVLTEEVIQAIQHDL